MSLIEVLASSLRDQGTLPNKYTVEIGGLIQQGRREAGFSAAELGELIYLTEREVAAVEAGKKEVKATELMLLAAALGKPISYFFPAWVVQQFEPNYLTTEELELLMLLRKLDDAQRRALLKQVRSMTLD